MVYAKPAGVTAYLVSAFGYRCFEFALPRAPTASASIWIVSSRSSRFKTQLLPKRQPLFFVPSTEPGLTIPIFHQALKTVSTNTRGQIPAEQTLFRTKCRFALGSPSPCRAAPVLEEDLNAEWDLRALSQVPRTVPPSRCQPLHQPFLTATGFPRRELRVCHFHLLWICTLYSRRAPVVPSATCSSRTLELQRGAVWKCSFRKMSTCCFLSNSAPHADYYPKRFAIGQSFPKTRFPRSISEWNLVSMEPP